MLTFYFDHHVPAAITFGLRRRGIDVVTAFEDGRAKTDDEALLVRATDLNRVLVTHDKGFHRIARRWLAADREFAGIVFALQNRIDTGTAIEYLEIFAHAMSADEARNRVEYLPSS